MQNYVRGMKFRLALIALAFLLHIHDHININSTPLNARFLPSTVSILHTCLGQ